ncbi:MAG: DUF2070 family protein [Thermoplasmata archaeon]|nr:DUF2070 family protein [Thermoplasmata archaeon]
MAVSPPPPSARPKPRVQTIQRYILRAPPRAAAALGIAVLLPVLATLVWVPAGWPEPFLRGLLLAFVLPAIAGLVLTTPLAAALGGRLAPRRGMYLVFMVSALTVPVLVVWRLLTPLPSVASVPIAAVLLLVQGPVLWFRHLSLFGVSRASHLRSLPPALVQPVVAVAGVFVLYPPTWTLGITALIYLLLGFASAALLLRAADRPMRREFSTSGVSLIRPLLDHVSGHDPAATETIEGFFRRFAIPADLRVTLVCFLVGARVKATLALPTVHPGPFAALGASDLPRKLAELLGPDAGTVLVPHTPCNHDLDLPTGAEVRQVGAAARRLLGELPHSSNTAASPLVAARTGGLARAQVLGDATVVLVTQAPAPTDDIDFSLADLLYREHPPPHPLALIDAHNSYVEDQGDLIYGTPAATQLVADVRAAVAAATAQSRPSTIEAGVAVREGYSIGSDGIGPHGIRALVVRAAGTTTAYVLIDGNNLLQGLRQPILDGLRGIVDAAEVMTTDNHVVHEVDGGINPVGERIPIDRLITEVRLATQAAVADLTAVEVRAGSVPIPAVPVLGPAWTARLLTSLGDTVSMFTNALLTTFLLLVAGSLVVLLATR